MVMGSVAILWFTGVAPGCFELKVPSPTSVKLFPDGTPVGETGYILPSFEDMVARYCVTDSVEFPEQPVCGDRGEPDAVELTDIAEVYPAGESTPLSVSFTNDEPLNYFAATLRFYTVDGGTVGIDSIHYVGRLADPSVCSFRILWNGSVWTDGVLPDSIGLSCLDVSGVQLPVGSGPLFEVFLTGTLYSGQVLIETSATARPLCDNGSVDSKSFLRWAQQKYITVGGEPLPPVPVFQPITDPVPVIAGEPVEFTVQASSPLGNPVELELLSLHPYDSIYGQPVSAPTFQAGVLTWTPDVADVGIWKANFEAEDLVTGRWAVADAVIQVVSGAEYVLSCTITEKPDVTQANDIVHGDYDGDGRPEIMIAGDPWSTGWSLAAFDYMALVLYETFVLQEDYPNRGLVTGYIDDDEFLDAVTCLYNEVWVLLGDGSGGFAVQDANIPRPAKTFIDAVLADYNGDAWLDYVCLSSPDVVTVYAGGTGAAFSQVHSFSIGTTCYTLSAADLNADGLDDLTIGTSLGIDVFVNDGLGGYDQSYSYTTNLGTYDIDITDQGSDFNSDGVYDLCVAAPGTDVNEGLSDLQVFFGQGDGTYEAASVRCLYGAVCASRAGDFNGDQLLDIAFINSTERYLAIVFGDGTGAFENEIRFDVPKYAPRRMDCMDIDLDGDMDFVVSAYEFDIFSLRSSLFVFLNELNPGGLVSASMRVTALDDVDVMVEGPGGEHLDRLSNTMPSASLYRRDLNNNESIDIDIRASAVHSGYYTLTVAPRPNLPAGETFSLNYTLAGETIRIARNLTVPQGEYVFPFYPDGNSKVSPFQGRCIRSEHPIFEWDLEQQPVPTIHRQSSLPFSDAPIEFRIASDADFTNVLETGTVTSGRYILRTALDVVDTVSYFWQIRNSGSTDWGGIFVFHALPVNEIPKDPVDTDANADDGLADEPGGGGEVPSGNQPSADSLSQCGETGVETAADGVPHQFALQQNHPNPFNPTTDLSYSLPREGHVRLDVFNVLGRLVATLVDEQQGPGYYVVTWDASRYASGVYLYRISMDGYSATKKMLLVK